MFTDVSNVENQKKIMDNVARTIRHGTTNRTEKKVELTEQAIARFYNSPQPVAALLLGCSLSSLKRRYYEISKSKGESGRRWPYQSLTLKSRKRFIYYVLNCREPEDATTLDKETLEALTKAFTVQTTRN
jgi:hypothetical protein